ncbi:MAG: hypothetical protein WC529_08815 [Candidatus Margulisiibacteriota bacterium]
MREWLNKWLPRDKRAHLLVGIGGGAFLGWYLPAKEIDLADVAWGVCGAIVGMSLMKLF